MRLLRVTVPVSDIDAATRFYEELLGLHGRRVADDRHHIRAGGATLVLYAPREPAPSAVPEPVYLAAEDLPAAEERARALGAEPDDDPGPGSASERALRLRDPDGNRLCIVDRRTAEED